MNQVLLGIGENTMRDYCRNHIDTFENWSRRLIDELFKAMYGADYFNHTFVDGKPLVKSDIKKSILERVSKDPNRFPRHIDAILLDDVKYFFCRDDMYALHFKSVLHPFYSGKDEVRSVLDRIITIRNKLSHGNTISYREAEQCMCYTNDFVDAYKSYYQKQGKEKDYNVPVFLRIKDCLGNDFVREDTHTIWDLDFRNTSRIHLRSGECYKLWVEVDNSFDSSSYDISWRVNLIENYSIQVVQGTGNEIIIDFTYEMVSYSPDIRIYITQKKDWHRFQTHDDEIMFLPGSVLPPIEETY